MRHGVEHAVNFANQVAEFTVERVGVGANGECACDRGVGHQPARVHECSHAILHEGDRDPRAA